VSRRRALRITGVSTAILLVVVLVVLVALAVTFVRRPLPDRGGQVRLGGMDGTATVLRDDQGVPQIYAAKATDLFRAQGYVQAQDQFFQMDLRRHITAGRLSELVGADEDAMKSDAVVRTLGWRRVAEQEWDGVSPSTRSYLQAFSEGVNDYIGDRPPSELSVSYTILGRSHPLRAIEPWTPVDSLAWLKAMAWDLRSNYDEELQRAQLYRSVGQVQRVDQIFPAYPYDRHQPIIPAGQAAPTGPADPAAGGSQQQNSLLPQAGRKAAPDQSDRSNQPDHADEQDDGAGPPVSRALQRALSDDGAQAAFSAADAAVDAVPGLLGKGQGIGSNSWVVGGELTASGLPLLANDPHLGVSNPGVWYQNGLHCTTVTEQCPFDVAGFSFAGMPGVVIGHNAQIAWGLTNEYPDVTDFYLERITGDQVEHDGEQVPLTTRQETIQVAGSRSVTITVRSTPHGPLLSDVIGEVDDVGTDSPVSGDPPDARTDYAVALAWTALQPGHGMDAILQLDVAKDFDTFRRAVTRLDAPAQNVIYADRISGTIGYQATGRIPVRGPGEEGASVPADGTWPHPGWEKSYDWTGSLPTSDLPHVENPPEHFIVAANQAVSAQGQGPYLTSDWDYGFRSQRIRDLLQQASAGGRKLTVDDMRLMQQDTVNPIARTLLPYLTNKRVTGTLGPFTMDGVKLLTDWDGSQTADSAAAAYFNVVWRRIIDRAFTEVKPDGGDRWFQVVAGLLPKENSSWWDDKTTRDVVESRDEVLRSALIQARLDLTARLGKDPKAWKWGRLHRVELRQTPLGRADSAWPVRKLVNHGPLDAPGGSSAVDAFAWDADSGSFDVTSAPSMRMIVDLSDWDSSRWVNQTGISDHPWDSHHGDQIDTWLTGGDYPWRFSGRAVQDEHEDRQALVPPNTP
jgi:penicillin amidase